MASYLHTRNGHYYLRLRIPSDIPSIFKSPEILKSLHTKDRKTARLSASCLRPKLLEVFTLTRCGFITEGQAREKLSCILDRKPKAQPQPLPIVEPQPLPTAQPTAQPQPPQEAPPILQPESLTLQQVIDEYTSDKASAWTAKTRLEYESYYRLLLNVIGDRVVSQIDRATVRDLRDTLAKLPPNLFKRFPGKTIKQVLSLPDLKPMSTTTVNKLLTLFGSLMIHCVKEGYRRDNPTEGLKVKQKRNAQEERKRYTKEDLTRVVSALPSPTAKPERYWIPWIGMLSGMRLGEICGLHASDVREVDGVWVFDVNEEGDKRLKTVSSTRLVPVHPKLIDLGLLRYVETLREKKTVRMWPKLARRDSDGYCAALGNWYGRFNRKHVTDDPQKSFHSLRHSFADTLKQLGVQEAMIAELVGHSHDSITMSRYGKRYQPQVLLECISLIEYNLLQTT